MKYNSVLLMALAIGLCVTLVFADNLQSAYAVSVTNYAVGGTVPNDALRFGNKVYVAETGSDQVNILTADSATSLATIALVGAVRLYEHNGRIYATGTANVQEIDASLNVALRVLAHGCTNGYGFSQDPTNSALLACYAAVANTVRQVNLDTMSVTFISTTTNAGATPCDIGSNDGMFVDWTADVAFIVCDVDNRIVGIEGVSASGTPDLAVAYTHAGRSTIEYNPNDRTLLIGGGTMTLAVYTPATSIALTVTYPTVTSNGNACYDSTSNRFAVLDGISDSLWIIDGTNGDTIVALAMTVNTGVGSGNQKCNFFTSSLLYMGANAVQFYIRVDLTGIPAGSGGSITPPTTGVDCSEPANANVLICRLGGDGSLVGAGNFIVGNVNGTTGLTPIICSVGIVDCVANPDMKTNGVGYLLVTIALAIIIGILWVASRGDLNSIPTFIWFIATLAIVGAFTLMDLIDATFLILTVIFIVALAAAKARGLFGGGDFK